MGHAVAMPNADEPSIDDQRKHLRSQLHIYGGIEMAMHKWPEVSALAFEAEEPDSLRQALIELLGVDDVQAAAISDMQVRRLSRRERDQIPRRVLELREQLSEMEGP
jgi:DNA gyrase subunit A